MQNVIYPNLIYCNGSDFTTAEATATAIKGKLQHCQAWDKGRIAQAILPSKWHYSSHIPWAVAFPSAEGRVEKENQLEKYKFTRVTTAINLFYCSVYHTCQASICDGSNSTPFVSARFFQR